MTKANIELRSPATGTIASGFSVLRRARGPELEAVTTELLTIATGYLGIDSIHYSPLKPKAETETVIVTSKNIRSKARLLGHLSRTEAYEAVEDTPAFSGEFRATATRLDPPDRRAPSGDRQLTIRFDEISEAELESERESIRVALAGLAGGPPKAIQWPPYKPELTLAYASAMTSDFAFGLMRQVVEDAMPFDLTLKKALILPRIRDQLT